MSVFYFLYNFLCYASLCSPRVLDLILPLAMSSIVDLAVKEAGTETEMSSLQTETTSSTTTKLLFHLENDNAIENNKETRKLASVEEFENVDDDHDDLFSSSSSSTSAFAINKRQKREQKMLLPISSNTTTTTFQTLLPKMPLTNGRYDTTTGNLQKLSKHTISTDRSNLLTNGNDTLEQQKTKNSDRSQNSDYMPVILSYKKVAIIYKKSFSLLDFFCFLCESICGVGYHHSILSSRQSDDKSTQ